MTTKRTPGARGRAAAKELADVPTQLLELAGMTVEELAARYRELYGEPTRSRNKAYLKKRLGWRIQELSEGGLPPYVLTRVAELGDALPERWLMRQAAAAKAKALEAGAGAGADADADADADAGEASQAGTPPAGPPRDPRLPPIGTVLRREHRGVEHEVTVAAEGFEYQGERFKTLSAVARRITGTGWNGFLFFGLTPSPSPARLAKAREAVR